MPAGGVASVRAGSWLVAPVTGGCCASPSATSWSGAGSSGTAPPCYCSLQVCRVEWQEKRQGWLVALVGREQEEKAKIILSFVFLDISLLLHSPTQDTEVWCAPPPWRREKPAGCAPCLAVASSYCGPPPPAGCCCSLQRPASWGPTPLLPLLLSNRSSLAPSLLLLLGRTILDPSYSTSATKRQYF